MEKLFYYESHLGGLYTDTRKQSFKELYCDECGDSDLCLGEFTPYEFLQYLIETEVGLGIDYPTGEGGYSIECVAEVIGLTEKQVLDYCKKHTEVKKIKDLTKEERDLIHRVETYFQDDDYIKKNHMTDCSKCTFGCELSTSWIRNQKDKDYHDNCEVRLDSYHRRLENCVEEEKREKERLKKRKNR